LRSTLDDSPFRPLGLLASGSSQTIDLDSDPGVGVLPLVHVGRVPLVLRTDDLSSYVTHPGTSFAAPPASCPPPSLIAAMYGR
jgi:hypothetical protein